MQYANSALFGLVLIGILSVPLVATAEVATTKDFTTDANESEFSLARDPVIRYVAPTGSNSMGDGSEGNPYGTIQYAIDKSLDGDEVWLLPGIYKGPGNRDIDPLGIAVVIRSSDNIPSTCVINCQGTVADHHRGFIFQNSETGTTVLRGVTIQNGYAKKGAGLQLGDPDIWSNFASPTIENCVFDTNTAVLGGGGIYANTGCAPSITDCLFLNNYSADSGGGLFLYWEHTAVVTRCEFIGNTAAQYGGGVVSNWEHESQFVDCLFQANGATWGGAFYSEFDNKKSTLRESDIMGLGNHFSIFDDPENSAWRGRSIFRPENSSITEKGGSDLEKNFNTVTNCKFLFNTADYGGAIYVTSSSEINFMNCWFEGNSANMEGGAVFDYYALNLYSFCIFLGNSAPNGGAMVFRSGYYPHPVSHLSVTNSTFAYNDGAIGNSVSFLDVQMWEYEIENSIIAFGTGGEAINVDGPISPVMNCVDIFDNEGGDWTGAIAQQFGINGNISEDPLFCDYSSGDLNLGSDSPCLPENHPDGPACGQIGSLGQGCLTIPHITSVSDVGNDQGGQVRLIWNRCQFDTYGSPTPITEYGIYRRQDENLVSIHPITRNDKLAGWDFIGVAPARGDEVYQFIAPTLCDSTISHDICWSVFMVSAMSAEPLVFFDSLPDSGYSLDNLAPTTPTLLALDGTVLSWVEATEPDFNSFILYGSTVAVLDEVAEILVQTNGTSHDLAGHAFPYIHLTAKDHAGNESPSVTRAISDVPGASPSRYALHDNVPNPFNPSTKIRFELPDAQTVSLVIYDLTGHVVRKLLVGERLGAATHERTWKGVDDSGRQVATGVYLYRLETPSFSETKRMVLLK